MRLWYFIQSWVGVKPYSVNLYMNINDSSIRKFSYWSLYPKGYVLKKDRRYHSKFYFTKYNLQDLYTLTLKINIIVSE